LFLASTILLGACSHQPEPELASPLQFDVEQSIAKAADRAAEAQETLAQVQVSRTKPTPSSLNESNLPEELQRPTTLDWSGPSHEAAERIATLIGYRFSIVGNTPSAPPMVHLSLKDVPAAKALEQIGLQSFPFGEVAVDPNVKRIEFRYLPAHQQPRGQRVTSTPGHRGPTK